MKNDKEAKIEIQKEIRDLARIIGLLSIRYKILRSPDVSGRSIIGGQSCALPHNVFGKPPLRKKVFYPGPM